jgi:hypothetical protein
MAARDEVQLFMLRAALLGFTMALDDRLSIDSSHPRVHAEALDAEVDSHRLPIRIRARGLLQGRNVVDMGALHVVGHSCLLVEKRPRPLTKCVKARSFRASRAQPSLETSIRSPSCTPNRRNVPLVTSSAPM